MLPWGISPVSICIYNSYQSEIGLKTASGGRRHAHKEAVCQKKKAQRRRMRDGNIYFYFVLAMFLESVACEHRVKNISVCDVRACFYVCLRTRVSNNTAILHNPSFILPLLSSLHFHYSSERFFATL